MWVTPITDRTAADVAARTAKGLLNAADLNRLEGDCAELAAILGVTITTKTDWTRTDFFAAADHQRILNNIQALRDAYYTVTSPDTPVAPLNDWQKWNAAESILQEIHYIYTAYQSSLFRCGEDCFCGEQIGVI